MSDGLLAGKVAVITGAGRGLGRECTRTFVEKGAKVVAVDISGAQNDLPGELGDAVLPFHADVTKEAELEAAFAAALDTFGRVDVVINNAGSREARAPGDVTVEEFERMMPVNLLSVVLGTKHGAKAMLRTGGGSIINISSTGALNASESVAPITYLAAKAGVHSLTKTFAIEYGEQNIRSNVIAPGLIYTQSAQREPDHAFVKPALKRPGRPRDVAELAAFLASDLANYITGAIIPVDGGWSTRLA